MKHLLEQGARRGLQKLSLLTYSRLQQKQHPDMGQRMPDNGGLDLSLPKLTI